LIDAGIPDGARKGMHEFMEAAIERRWPDKGVHAKAQKA
jgi:hypothetical protein